MCKFSFLSQSKQEIHITFLWIFLRLLHRERRAGLLYEMCPDFPSSHPSLSPPLTSVNEKEAASVQDAAVCTADHRGGKPKITAATVEMLEVGGNRWGAEVREDRE